MWCPPRRSLPTSSSDPVAVHALEGRIRRQASAVARARAAGPSRSACSVRVPSGLTAMSSLTPRSSRIEASALTRPAKMMTGVLWRRAICATPNGVLPSIVWASTLPSPVKTQSAAAAMPYTPWSGAGRASRLWPVMVRRARARRSTGTRPTRLSHRVLGRDSRARVWRVRKSEKMTNDRMKGAHRCIRHSLCPRAEICGKSLCTPQTLSPRSCVILTWTVCQRRRTDRFLVPPFDTDQIRPISVSIVSSQGVSGGGPMKRWFVEYETGPHGQIAGRRDLFD
jgi:hypothetical protein